MNEKQKVLSYLNKHGSITSYEAYQHLGITQLGRVLSDLEKQGHEFNRDEWEKRNGKRYKRYSLAGGQTSMFSDAEVKMPGHRREVEGI